MKPTTFICALEAPRLEALVPFCLCCVRVGARSTHVLPLACPTTVRDGIAEALSLCSCRVKLTAQAARAQPDAGEGSAGLKAVAARKANPVAARKANPVGWHAADDQLLRISCRCRGCRRPPRRRELCPPGQPTAGRRKETRHARLRTVDEPLPATARYQASAKRYQAGPGAVCALFGAPRSGSASNTSACPLPVGSPSENPVAQSASPRSLRQLCCTSNHAPGGSRPDRAANGPCQSEVLLLQGAGRKSATPRTRLEAQLPAPCPKSHVHARHVDRLSTVRLGPCQRAGTDRLLFRRANH